MRWRRRRFDSWVEWDRHAKLEERRADPVATPDDVRRGLLQLSAWMGGMLLLLAGFLAAATSRMLPRFDATTAAGWVHGIQVGTMDERLQAIRQLRTSALLAQIPCPPLLALVDTGADDDLRRIAVPTIAESLRSGHCLQPLLALLDSTASDDVRRSALAVLALDGTSVANAALVPVLHALNGPPATRGDAVMALSSLADTSSPVLEALERAFHANVGDTRTQVLASLVHLKPRCRWMPLIRTALSDHEATARLLAVHALEDVALADTNACVPIGLVVNLLHDPDRDVRMAMSDALGRSADALLRPSR